MMLLSKHMQTSKNVKIGVRGRKKIAWWSTVRFLILGGPVEGRVFARPQKTSFLQGVPRDVKKRHFCDFLMIAINCLFYSVADSQWKHSFRSEACIAMMQTHHWDVQKLQKTVLEGVQNGQGGPWRQNARPPLLSPKFGRAALSIVWFGTLVWKTYMGSIKKPFTFGTWRQKSRRAG